MGMLLYDSLSRKKKPLQPIQPGNVRIYLCGITVYDHCHIGHARTAVFFDMVCRYFKTIGLDTQFVRNITDIDDKIIQRANEQNISWQLLTEQFINAMHEDYAKLDVNPPTKEPKATECISEIIALIEKLLDKGAAYIAPNNDVYFDVTAYSEYGALAQQSADSLLCGARVEVNHAKKSPLDFVLWKQAKPNEPSWPSPWGEGRPGWHIECSAMASTFLGETIDIHGGGNDLKFPHHENERAQSEAASNQTFVNHWVHVGFVQIDNEKMSKSLNNFFTIRDVLAEYDAEVIRYFLLANHYRSPVNYSRENLDQARNSLETLYTALRGCTISQETGEPSYQQAFDSAMQDDFNVPVALTVLFELAKNINKCRSNDAEQANIFAGQLKRMANVLGVCQQSPESFLQGAQDNQSQIEALILERTKARTNKDFAKADAIRDELAVLGIAIEDTPQGTIWRKA